VGYPAEELYAVLTIESRRARCEVVGEDLGTVADEVHDAMARHRLRRMVVLPFEMDVKEPKRAGGRPRPVGELRPVPPLSVASVGTHDLPPFAAFWSGRDLEGVPGKEDELEERARWRGALAALLHREGLMADETVPEEEQVRRAHQGALALLAGSPAEHLLVGVEDLWLETEPQNRPGTGGEMNWTRKARYPLEEWSRLAGVEETLAAVREARRRGPGPPRARSRKERAR
jgi:4-alpha-glucanotransferase